MPWYVRLRNINAPFPGRDSDIEEKINFIKPMLMRFLHMPAALCVSLPLYRRFCEAQTVFAPVDPPAVKTDARGMLITCCLLSMCVILTMDHCKTGKDSVK